MFVIFLTFTACKETKVIEIDSNSLLEDIRVLSDNSFEGRLFSSQQNYRARKHIVDRFKQIGLEPVNGNYEEEFTVTLKKKNRQDLFPIKKNVLDGYANVPDTTVVGGNAFGMLKGETNKTIVVTAHFDHLGIKNGKIYNGADDNASGVAALFAMAKYFKDKPTKHNIIFAAVDAEEIGSLGADYFLKNYNDKENIVLNINMDMIAHSDYDPDFFACGLFHFPNLRDPLEEIESTKVNLLFGHDDPMSKQQADWTFSSDHRVFYRQKIPFIYFGVPDHKDYHRSTDTFATINQEFFIETVKIVIQATENLDLHFYEEAQ